MEIDIAEKSVQAEEKEEREWKKYSVSKLARKNNLNKAKKGGFNTVRIVASARHFCKEKYHEQRANRIHNKSKYLFSNNDPQKCMHYVIKEEEKKKRRKSFVHITDDSI